MDKDLIEALGNVGDFFLGKNFLKGNTFKDFIRDGFRLFVFIFLPFIPIAIHMFITILIELIIGG